MADEQSPDLRSSGDARSVTAQVETPFEVVEDEWAVADFRLRLLRPSDPASLDDPLAESSPSGPVWARVWRSASGLAATVADESLEGARVAELGCGLGLVGLVAAARGAQVLLTDRSALALAFAATSAERNGLRLDAARCDWDSPSALVGGAPWDLVLAADVIYDERSAKLLLDLLPRLVEGGGEVMIADPGRGVARLFIDASSLDWRVERGRCGPDVLLYRLRPRGG